MTNQDTAGTCATSNRSSSCGSDRNVGEWERGASVGAGCLMTYLGLKEEKPSWWVAAGLGAGLIYRGLTGYCHLYQLLGINTAEHPDQTAVPAREGVKVEKSILVDGDAHELFDLWRGLVNLPVLFSHLKEIVPHGPRRSHWVATGPFGQPIEWDAEIFNERDGRLIAWRSLPGGDIETAGSVHFSPADMGTTRVDISMKYNPPAGRLGDLILWWFGSGLKQVLEKDFQRFEQRVANFPVGSGSDGSIESSLLALEDA